MSIEKDQLKKIVEGALMAAGQPLSVSRLLALFDEEQERPAKDEIQATLEDIQAECTGRGYELKEVGTGWRFQVCAETAPWVNRLFDEKPQKYSRALLETLALIAYRQPITRGDIEEIRGVAVSSHIIKTLTEREWVKAVGHRDVPGRPSLYATTRQFLDYFNLTSLEDLPSLGEISDLEKLNPELELGIAEAGKGAQGGTEDTQPAQNSETAEAGESEEPSAETDEEPLVEVDEEPSAELDEEPSAELDEEPSAELDEEASAELDEEPSAELDEEPSAELDEEPSAELDKEAATEETSEAETPESDELEDEHTSASADANR